MIGIYERGDQYPHRSKYCTYDRVSHTITGQDVSPTHLRRSLEGSLRRLGTDVIDLYQS